MAAKKLRIAVIGAGGAGLCSARHILSRPVTFEPPVVFEKTGQVGGTWVYTEEVGGDSGVHSSMYRDLRTNLPKEIMQFPDFAFAPSLPSFIHHSDVQKYLEDYTDHFSVRPHIKFNTQVLSVSPMLVEGEKDTSVSWNVTSKTEGDTDAVTQRFDAIMVCVGHYSQPFVPNIEGIENFQGQVLHSHFYRFPEVFSSRSVVLIGGGTSGIDIALELSPHAKHVTLSHRGSPPQWTPPENISLVPPVARVCPTSLICEDGTEITSDTLIFSTGYKYSFPFLLPVKDVMLNQRNTEKENTGKIVQTNCEKLTTDCEKNGETIQSNKNRKIDLPKSDLLEEDAIVGPDVERGHLPPLYKHLFHARYPTMGFIGACKIVLPFPLFHCQAQFFLVVLEGKFQLPPPDQMLSESREEVKEALKNGITMKYLHRLEITQWEYNQWLADTAGFEPLAPVLSKVFKAVRDFRNVNPLIFRKLKVRVLNREEFEMNVELLKNYQ